MRCPNCGPLMLLVMDEPMGQEWACPECDEIIEVSFNGTKPREKTA
jgi:hypothetical protein